MPHDNSDGVRLSPAFRCAWRRSVSRGMLQSTRERATRERERHDTPGFATDRRDHGLLLALLATTANATGPTTHWVDRDGNAGPNGCGGAHAASMSIQPAIDASGPGDTVLVCPGRYVEQVYIHGPHAGLTLRSVERYGARIFAPQTLTTFNQAPALVMGDHVSTWSMPRARPSTAIACCWKGLWSSATT